MTLACQCFDCQTAGAGVAQLVTTLQTSRSRSGPGFGVDAPPHARDGSSGKYVGDHWMNKKFQHPKHRSRMTVSIWLLSWHRKGLLVNSILGCCKRGIGKGLGLLLVGHLEDLHAGENQHNLSSDYSQYLIDQAKVYVITYVEKQVVSRKTLNALQVWHSFYYISVKIISIFMPQ
jgi:hypothetical protein